jgi:hypothetical protein
MQSQEDVVIDVYSQHKGESRGWVSTSVVIPP